MDRYPAGLRDILGSETRFFRGFSVFSEKGSEKISEGVEMAHRNGLYGGRRPKNCAKIFFDPDLVFFSKYSMFLTVLSGLGSKKISIFFRKGFCSWPLGKCPESNYRKSAISDRGV